MKPWDLIAAAAWNLTRQRLVIRAQPPAEKGYLGMTKRRADGAIIIDITPTLSDDKFLEVLLHELAHARIHAPKFAPSDVDRPPQSVKDAPRPPIARIAYNIRETEADKLADRWQVYAILFSDFQQGQTELEKQLKALANMKG